MMYTIDIRIEVDATAFPCELKNIELAELVVESAVGCSLQDLFETVSMKDVSINPTSGDVERDWDSLLS